MIGERANAGLGVAPLTARRLHQVVARTQAEGRLPSLTAGVVRDGRLVWSTRVGDEVGDTARGLAATDVPHRIGSITKTLTALLILQLERDGQIDLDQTASTWLSDVGYADRPLRELLAHVSGMPSEPQGSWWERSPGLTWEVLAAANPTERRPFAPGERYHYSNLGFALLGQVASRVAGDSWWNLVQTRVLDPLHLPHTSYDDNATAAQGFSVDPWTGALVPEPHADTGAMAPAGQAWASLDDLARYAAFLIEGNDRVLGREALRRAFTPTSGAPETGLGGGHALGFQLHRGGSGTLAGHTGSMPGFLAACLVDTQWRTGAVLLANGTWGFDPGALAVELVETLQEWEPALPTPWRPSDPVPTVVSDVVGTWHWGTAPFTFTWEGSQLVTRLRGEVASRFEVRDDQLIGVTGYHAGERLEVHRDDLGTVTHLVVATFVHTRTPYDPAVEIPGGHPR